MLPDDLTKKSSTTVCPVPSEQRPLNEYEALKESWFFRWATLDIQIYIRKIIWVWVMGWTIAAPVAAASFPVAKYPVKFLLVSTGGGLLLLSLALIRLYLGWTYISSRLTAQQVIYEESGWYDGQSWTKPTEVLARDRLVVSYQIQPIVKRLQNTFGSLALILLAGICIWRIL